jgi:hypothetical protein
MATNTKPLKQRSTDELETAIQSGYFDNIQKSEAERILREREREPDRKLARRTYNAAAWARAYSEGTFIVALIILWLLATGEPPATTSRQAPKAAEPETSLLVTPPIETAKPETSSLAVPTIAAPQEAPAPPIETGKPETSPPAAAPIETAEPAPAAPRTAEPKEAATQVSEPEPLPSAPPAIAAPAEAPLPSPEAPALAAPGNASPEAPPSRPNAASTEAQPTAPAASVAEPPRKRTSSPRRSLNAHREAPDAWKKGTGILGSP